MKLLLRMRKQYLLHLRIREHYLLHLRMRKPEFDEHVKNI